MEKERPWANGLAHSRLNRRSMLFGIGAIPMAELAEAAKSSDPAELAALMNARARELAGLLWTIAPPETNRIGITLGDARPPDPEPGLWWTAMCARQAQVWTRPDGSPIMGTKAMWHLSPDGLGWI
ncbi:hypothetical protein [Oceanicella actignis]|uniref:Uncharacterized protein n=1 Tax=Oceanicella actignis TaxID=1189325 RepID=A0A1M7SNC1_9RHOB|nr:hypothetical protein [Oceanicella actignis]SES64392.1 hypothetical protein SAMN04488119_10110 [Oceanicella actignis]SHN59953.1 hypothetical protein SAMN05216200_10311 [Oceanicella actignis]